MAWRSWRSSLYLMLLVAVGATVAVGIFRAGTSDALIRRRTITPEVDTGLRIQTDGRHVSMTGPMACDPGENWEVQGNLTQRGTRGEGRSEGVCRGNIQEWVTRIAAQGSGTFTPGAARGCAVLRTIKGSDETDRHEWCNDIKLVAAGAGPEEGTNGVVSWVALAVAGVAALVAIVALVRPRRTV